jgi:Hemerythrin HHE cation binding domain
MSRVPAKPDLTFVTLIHQSLRADAARLAAAIAELRPSDRRDRLPAVQAFFGHYRDQLILHHRHEDELFFPALAARVGPARMHCSAPTSRLRSELRCLSSSQTCQPQTTKSSRPESAKRPRSPRHSS